MKRKPLKQVMTDSPGDIQAGRDFPAPKTNGNGAKPASYQLSPNASALFLEIREKQNQLQAQMAALMAGAGLDDGNYSASISPADGRVSLTPQPKL